MSKPPVRKPPAPKRAAPPPVMKDRIISTKKFTVNSWIGDDGEKIILYGQSGIGKTTLASMLPDPVWIGLDDGGRKIKNPKTGDVLKFVPEIETFEDVRAVLQSNTFDDFQTIVIDTITELQALALPATFRRVQAGKGQTASNIEDYGFHKGYRHWYDTMCMILGDCDRHVRAGRNIVMLAQHTTNKQANPSGEDFLIECPDLYHDKNTSIHDKYVSWADHVLRIGYANVVVEERKASSAKDRAVFIQPEVHFVAKSRTIPIEYDLVEFNEPSDDSIWRLIFGEEND